MTRKSKLLILEVGGGRLTIPLLQNNYKVTAIDIDKKAQKQLLKTSIKIRKNNNLQISKVFSKVDKYDYILGTDILHHIEIAEYFGLFKNNLKKNGKIIFSEPNFWNISWSVFIFLFLDWKQEKGIVQIRYFNLIKQLELAGYKKIKIIGLFLFPPQ